jgi:hypothetical protein
MYYIYHIPGIKIGCSTEPQRRVKTQGYTDFNILEEHTDIHIASNREIELQKEYGYKVDNTSYEQSYDWCNRGYSNGGKKTGELLKASGEWEKRRQKGWVKAKQVTSKPIIVYHYPSMEIKGEYKSVSDACRDLNLQRVSVIRILSRSIGKIIKGALCYHHHHYTFRYK